MKTFRLVPLVVLIVGALVTTVAFAAPAPAPSQGQATCPDGNGWTKIDSDDLSLYPVAGADAYCFKAGSDQSQGCTGGLFDAIPAGGFGNNGYCGLSHWSYHMPEYQVCSVTTGPVYGEWSEWSAWTWNEQEQTFERTRTRSVTYYDSQDPQHVCSSDTETDRETDPACPFNPEIRSGDPECVPPPGQAGATLSPYCGGGINVTVANAVLNVKLGDQDPTQITTAGQYPLALGAYTAWAEANEGFEFPDGATTQWSFTIESCPRPPEEPPTGPLDSIALSTVGQIAGPGMMGIGLLGLAFRRKRH